MMHIGKGPLQFVEKEKAYLIYLSDKFIMPCQSIMAIPIKPSGLTMSIY